MSFICKKCGESYIGETIDFRTRMNAHQTSSSSEGAAVMEAKKFNEIIPYLRMEVSGHLFDCGLRFWACPLIKMREENIIARLVKEDYLINLLKPDLNADKRNLLHLSWAPRKAENNKKSLSTILKFFCIILHFNSNLTLP